MIKNTDNGNIYLEENNETTNSSESNWQTIISPIVYLIITLIVLWNDKDNVMYIINLSYGWVVLRFILKYVINTFLFELFISIIVVIRFGIENSSLYRNLVKLITSLIYIFICYVGWNMQKEDLNKSELSSERTAITEVAGCEITNSKNVVYYIKFYCNGEMHKMRMDYEEWRKFHKGDTIIVTYNTGIINKDIYNKIEIVKGATFLCIDTIDIWKGYELSPKELKMILKES